MGDVIYVYSFRKAEIESKSGSFGRSGGSSIEWIIKARYARLIPRLATRKWEDERVAATQPILILYIYSHMTEDVYVKMSF